MILDLELSCQDLNGRSPRLNKRSFFSKPLSSNYKTGWSWDDEIKNFMKSDQTHIKLPKISIITPSYNQGQYLEQTICSVLDQGYPNLEYIIVDGGSTDNSVEIIKKYESSIHYWVSEPDRGQSHAINKGMQICTGDIINWLNSDDFLIPGSLSKLALMYTNRTSDIFIIAGNAQVLRKDGTLTQRKLISSTSGWVRELGPSYEGGIQASWFFSRELLKLLGPLNESLHFTMDIDYSIRWTRFNPEYLIENEPLAVFRVHTEAKTSKFVVNSMNERLELFKYHIDKLPISQSEKREILSQMKQNISWHYMIKLTNPINFSYLLRSIWLYPKRVLTKDFWITLKNAL